MMETQEKRALDRQEMLMVQISEVALMVIGSLGALFGLWLMFGRDEVFAGMFITFASAFIMMSGVVRIFAAETRQLRYALADAHATLTWLEVCAKAEREGPDRRCLLPVGHVGGHRFGPLEQLLEERGQKEPMGEALEVAPAHGASRVVAASES